MIFSAQGVKTLPGMQSHSVDVSQLGFTFFNLLTQRVPQIMANKVLIDCNTDPWSRLCWFDFKSAWSAVFWTSGISRHADAWRPISCADGLICQPCFDCLVVTSTLNDSSISLPLCEKSISADTAYDEINIFNLHVFRPEINIELMWCVKLAFCCFLREINILAVTQSTPNFACSFVQAWLQAVSSTVVFTLKFASFSRCWVHVCKKHLVFP